MTIYYSSVSESFYDSENDYPNGIPSGAVEVSVDDYRNIQQLMSIGYLLSSDSDGNPVLIPPKQQTSQELSVDVKNKRDKLLSATDYLVMPDYPITSERLELVKKYRQVLRDITKQPEFPSNINWPIL